MNTQAQALLDQYWAWLKAKTVFEQRGDWLEITTPFLDRHNDYLQIYMKQDETGIVLTDDAYIIEDLIQSGCDFDTPRRREILEITIRGLGVQLQNHSLVVHASRDNFAMKKHNLVQAMLAVNDLFYTAPATIVSMFYEDVTQWLDSAAIRYSPRIKLSGKSGFDHMFDFVIPASQHAPERIIKVISRPSKDKAQSAAFAWIDTREVRKSDTRAYVVLNDSEVTVSPAIIEALTEYGMKPVAWSRRDDVRDELVV